MKLHFQQTREMRVKGSLIVLLATHEATIGPHFPGSEVASREGVGIRHTFGTPALADQGVSAS
jgi:hypothetical protein